MPTDFTFIAALISAIVLALVVVFQLCIVAGAPWGEYCYGGYHKGVLPKKFRIASALAVIVWTLAALMFLHIAGYCRLPISATVVHASLWVLTILNGLGTIVNAISKSKKERNLWTPLLLLMLCMSIYLLVKGF